MRKPAIFVVCVMAVAMAAATLIKPTPRDDAGFTLVGVIPGDVFLYAAERTNPEQGFLRGYWGDVIKAALDSGIGDDAIGLLGLFLNADQSAEFDRLKDRTKRLITGVDWRQLAAEEFVFAERFSTPLDRGERRSPMMMPDMVWLMRGSAEGAEHNYTGLVAILEAIVDEVNKKAGSEALTLQRGQRHGAEVVSVNFFERITGAPKLTLSIAQRDDVIMIALREQLFEDVLALMDGTSDGKSLDDSARFNNAFTLLPTPEDSMFFFDMQAMLRPIKDFITDIVEMALEPEDVYRKTAMNREGGQINSKALRAYALLNYPKALELIREAHEADQDSSIILYNLACFNALNGNTDEALDWLDKAVDGGFFAPKKIAGDSDLNSLRGSPRYKAALARAEQHAQNARVNDVVVNASKNGDAYRLTNQAMQAHVENDYETGLKLAQQALEAAPDDPNMHYNLACFHALLGHEGEALRYLESAVDAGYYCPSAIEHDDDLSSIRDSERYLAAVALARDKATALSSRSKGEQQRIILGLINRIANDAGVLDYTASVGTTEGYSVHKETVAVLVPDAKQRPIYKVFGSVDQLTDFERYLPAETESFSVSTGVNVNGLYEYLEDTIKSVGPKGEQLLDEWDRLQDSLGFDVHADVLDWMGQETVSVTLADGRGSVLLMEVKDEAVAREKVAAAVEFASTKFTEIIAEASKKNPAMAMLGMLTVSTSPVQQEGLEGFQNLHLGPMPQPAVWGVADGRLIFGSSADAVALCLATARGEHPGIRDNERVMAEAVIPDGPFAAMMLKDRRHDDEKAVSMLGSASMAAMMIGASVPRPELKPIITKAASMLGKLGPVARKVNFYKSNASSTTFDGHMWRTHSVTHYFSPEERDAQDSK